MLYISLVTPSFSVAIALCFCYPVQLLSSEIININLMFEQLNKASKVVATSLIGFASSCKTLSNKFGMR